MTNTQKEINLLMGVNRYTLKSQRTVLNLPFQVKFMENTCITKKDNYPEAIKYHRHKTRERKKEKKRTNVLSLLKF